MSFVTFKKGPRISLSKVFFCGLAGILLIFTLLSYFSFSRLLSFESALIQVSEKTLPKIINTSQLFNQAARLLQSTELLSKSSSQASKRLVERQLNASLEAIRKASRAIQSNKFLDIQLDTISTELDEFSILMSDLLELRNQMQSLKIKIAILGEQASKVDPSASSNWLLDYLQALINTGQALDETRLQRVRFLFDQLQKRLVSLNSYADTAQNKLVKQHLTNELNILLFAENGLAQLKIKTLRIEGKVIGRENFVHNLIEDYVAHLGFVTTETEQEMTVRVAASISEMQIQTQLISAIIIASVIFLLVITILFQRRVLKRLKIVNRMVSSETRGDEYQATLHGNDEITDLAETFKEFAYTIEQQQLALEKFSFLDSLTQIANRRALEVRLDQDIEIAQRQDTPIALLLMDIDFFKQFNQTYGHKAGDKCLQNIAKTLSNLLTRDGDFIGRYGGEEFIFILPDTDKKVAQEMAQKVIDELERISIPHEYSSVAEHLTMSIGITIWDPSKSLLPEALIQQADKALNVAKSSGKNCFKVFQ